MLDVMEATVEQILGVQRSASENSDGIGWISSRGFQVYLKRVSYKM